MPMVKEEGLSSGGDHPEPSQLERFLRGQLPRTEVRDIVRHLLTGCPRCREETRRLWKFAEPVPSDPEPRDGTGRGSSHRLLRWRY